MTELKQAIFNEKMNQVVVHTALRWLLNSRRQGTHKAKTRTEVSGGGVKPWKQKGTGRARAGSNRSPLWRKGGVIFPPTPRDHSFRLPVKVRKLALRVALSDCNRATRLKVVGNFSLPAPKAKEGAKFIAAAGVSGKVLLVEAEHHPEFEKGIRNIPGVTLTLARELNIFDLLKSEWILIEESAVPILEERLG